jgi:FkbM family methyltransferase
MKQGQTHRRSIKLIIVDCFISVAFRSAYVKEKLKIFADRVKISYCGYNFSYLSHENGELEFIDRVNAYYAEKPFRFFDVGAHHGTYTSMIIGKFKDYKGYLFEPTPTSFEVLQSRFRTNANLKLNNLALADFTGSSIFIVYPDDPTRNGLTGVGKEINFGSEEIVCSVTSGVEYCLIHDIKEFELLKIDAEGHDFSVIEGFDEMISKNLIDLIQFEYTFKHADLGVPLRRYYEFFKSRGYLFGPIRKRGVEFYSEFDPRFNEYDIGPNYLAVKANIAHEFKEFKLL